MPPTVIDGMRSPSSAPERTALPPGPDPRTAPKAAPGEVVYQSRYKNFVLQLKSQRDVILDGQVIQGDNRKIVFRDYTYRTEDPWEIERIERYKGYGLDGVVWRAEAYSASLAKAEYDGFINKLKGSPEMLERLRADLNKSDFDVLEAVVTRHQKPEDLTTEQLEKATAP